MDLQLYNSFLEKKNKIRQYISDYNKLKYNTVDEICENMKESSRKYYRKNYEKERERKRKYYLENKNEILERRKAARLAKKNSNVDKK